MELLIPPLLATALMVVASLPAWSFGDSLIESVIAFPIGCVGLLFFAYLFSATPSLIYTLVMEVWYRAGLNARFGYFCTAGLSSLLGAGAGFLVASIGVWLGFLTSPDCAPLTVLGAIVGLLSGFYVAKKQASAAYPVRMEA